MGVGFGLIAAVVFAIVAALITAALGFRDGVRPGDARVSVRALSADEGEGLSGRFAEITIRNGHDSPVVVSARARRASVLSLLVAAPHAHRTAFTHRRHLGDVEVLGAVDGRGAHRYLLPLDRAHAASRVTVLVDQAARRTRVTTATLRASAAHPLRSTAPRDAADV